MQQGANKTNRRNGWINKEERKVARRTARRVAKHDLKVRG